MSKSMSEVVEEFEKLREEKLTKHQVEVTELLDKYPHLKGLAERPAKKDILDKAIEAVADRGLNYGKPEDNFARIARRWQLHFLNRYGVEITVDAHDVAMMMADMKIARLENDPSHLDSWIDIAGYAACGGNLPVAK